MQSLFDRAEVQRELVAALPGYMIRQRWFGDKSRSIDTVAITATFSIERTNSPIAICVVDVHFSDGPKSRYLLPVSIAEIPEDNEAVICTVTSNDRALRVRDAIHDESFRDWILELLIQEPTVQPSGGALETDVPPSASHVLRSLRGGESRVLQAEQSNSSLVFSDRAFVKFFRKLQVGPNPDVELVRFLTVKAGFAHVPAYLGSLSYRRQTGETAVLAVAQEFVPARSDGWSYVRSLLDRVIDEGHSGAATVESVAFAEGLGTVTADMHLALSSDPWSAQFAPEIITPEDVAQWKADYLRVLETVIRGLNDKRSELDTFTGELVSAFLAISRGLEARAQGLDRLVGRSKIRVHGDYHLGQTLRTAAGKLVVLDFEGEPQRSLAERREKKSPLKDVAGMLRSFSYSRGAAANTLNPGQAQESATLVAWERKMKAAFLASYTAVAEQHGARFIPLSQSDLQEAVAAWELDKAVYEVLYELNNRPSWLWIPLTGMLKLGEP